MGAKVIQQNSITEQDISAIVNENLKLVHSCAAKFRGRGIEYDDLFQAGCIGLLKAIKNFDQSLGFKLSTYAVPVILGEIKQIFRENSIVKVSRSVKELSMKVKRECEIFMTEQGREPTINEVAEKLCIEPEQVASALNATITPLSLTPIDENNDSSQIDLPIPAPDEKLTELMSLRKEIDELNKEDRSLILLRFFKNYTQTQTAKILGMTQVQVSRREKAILKKLRSKLI